MACSSAPLLFQLSRRVGRMSSLHSLRSVTKRSFGTDDDIDKRLFTEEIKIKMPDMGEGEGKILTWYKEEGDLVKRGDVLCDIETADFTFGMETDDEQLGIMGSILVPAPSEMIANGKTICIVLHKPNHRD